MVCLYLDIRKHLISYFPSKPLSCAHYLHLSSPLDHIYFSLPFPPHWFCCLWKSYFPNSSHFSNSSGRSLECFLSTTDFTTTVLRAAYMALPRTLRFYTSKCVPRWNSDCTKALRLEHAAWNSYRYKWGTPNQLSALISFKRASACLCHTISNSKSNSWQNYVSLITSSMSISTVWHQTHNLSGRHPPIQPASSEFEILSSLILFKSQMN